MNVTKETIKAVLTRYGVKADIDGIIESIQEEADATSGKAFKLDVPTLTDEKLTVTAYRTEDASIAYHRAKPGSRTWSLSHIGTGQRLCDVSKVTDARKLAAGIAQKMKELGIDLARVSFLGDGKYAVDGIEDTCKAINTLIKPLSDAMRDVSRNLGIYTF